ncbi:3-isopropylmalate dehydratase small subunit [Halovivax limisalsi]|uniref:3-isopropylmalate dehydratase small subunit n=1 Tax=Halovivax limisalsi TaxID=1453760 RepID=UPI001FFC4849|nr:3-isopropylmalate dehydratase small subunit [Halovivax limisalsi]
MTGDEAAEPTTAGPDPVERVRGTGIPVRGNEIDTDQILPARFLKAVTFEGLGQFAFFDQRFDENDDPLDHPFNDDRFTGASILVVNSNFGCGSSREHAPQALMRWGIDAIVGESFAEIFAGNCLGLGIPTVTADHESVVALQDWIEDNPDDSIAVSVAAETVTYGGTTLDVTVDEAQRRALVDGNWDTTALMRQNAESVRETAESLPYVDLEPDDGIGRTGQ